MKLYAMGVCAVAAPGVERMRNYIESLNVTWHSWRLGVAGLLCLSIGGAVSAQTIDAAMVVAAHPGGGAGLVNAVSDALVVEPETVVQFCEVAGSQTPEIQSAIGVGFFNALDMLLENDQHEDAGLIGATACEAEECEGAIVTSFAAAAGVTLDSMCRISWADISTPLPSLFAITEIGGGGGGTARAQDDVATPVSPN